MLNTRQTAGSSLMHQKQYQWYQVQSPATTGPERSVAQQVGRQLGPTSAGTSQGASSPKNTPPSYPIPNYPYQRNERRSRYNRLQEPLSSVWKTCPASAITLDGNPYLYK